MIAYKGFNKDMTCRGYQYEEGKTYECDTAKMCEEGFHACENPLNCFRYYLPANSVYHEVEIEDNGERQSDDSKVVGTKIKIGAKLDVAKICKLHFEYVKAHCEPSKSNVAGEQGVSSSRGASSVGENGVAVARGNGCKVKGGIGAILVLCEENNDNYEIKFSKTFRIDGKRYKTDTWYKLDKNGKVVKADVD